MIKGDKVKCRKSSKGDNDETVYLIGSFPTPGAVYIHEEGSEWNEEEELAFFEDGSRAFMQLALADNIEIIKEKIDPSLLSDPKYLGIPNICFSLTKQDDDREPKMRLQRLERGFDDSETWSLRDTIARFIIPRLERYEEISKDFLKREPELISDIESFLLAMKLISRDSGACMWSKEEEEQVTKGLEAFPKVFMSLWW